MLRCLDLARMGAGMVDPNPMVGAVLVHEGRVIGEGYHQQYGGPHAEVNCISAVAAADRKLISKSILYVSLEPCAHHGKTPPCSDLIIEHQIQHVVIACKDPFSAVNGKGVEKLKAAGIQVTERVLEHEATVLNKRFFCFHNKQRPYVILKWAASADGKMGGVSGERIKISNSYSDRLVHQWRSEEAAIMIGTNTALVDDPQLTTRLWPGKDPVRVIVDRELKLPAGAKVLDGTVKTIVFNQHKEESIGLTSYIKIPGNNSIRELLKLMHREGVLSVLVEGGSALLRSFIAEGLWDEARRIINPELEIGDGVAAPEIETVYLHHSDQLKGDSIQYFINSTR